MFLMEHQRFLILENIKWTNKIRQKMFLSILFATSSERAKIGNRYYIRNIPTQDHISNLEENK